MNDDWMAPRVMQNPTKMFNCIRVQSQVSLLETLHMKGIIK